MRSIWELLAYGWCFKLWNLIKLHMERGYSYLLEWLVSTRQGITSAGEVVEKKKPSFSVGMNVNLYRHHGKQYAGAPQN